MRSRRLALAIALVATACSGSDDAASTAVTPPPASADSIPSTGVVPATSATTPPPAETTSSGSVVPTETSAVPTTTMFDPDLLPSMPTPATPTGTDASERAAALVTATNDDAADASVGWLAAYAELGLPVIDPSGGSTRDDGDPIGPSWDIVWALGTLSRGKSTIPLTDAARVLGWDETEPSDPDQMLADLRAAASSSDPALQTFGLFVAGRSVANGGADPTDPATLPEQVWFDAATLHLITWVVTRDVMVEALDADVLEAATPGFASARAQAKVPCSEIVGGSSTVTSWLNFLAGKLGGGTGVEGIGSMPGIAEAWVTKVRGAKFGEDVGKAAGARTAAMLAKINFTTSLLSLIAQMNSVSVGGDMEPTPLNRHRQNTDGDTATIRVDLSFSSATFDGNNAAVCVLSMLANVLGVSLSLPPDGADLTGVEVIVTPGKNFPDKVYFADGGDPERTTDGSGSFTIGVQGRAREVTLPQTAPEVADEFGLNYATQVEEVTAQSLINVFMDGLQLHNGLLAGAIDIAKSLHYDLGETIYPFRDYVGDLRVDGDAMGLHFTATKCGGMTGTWEFTITSPTIFPTGGPATVTIEPLPGSPVEVYTEQIDFVIVSPQTGYSQNFQLIFYADGADTPWGAPAGAPALGIDEAFGGTGLPMEVGSFC